MTLLLLILESALLVSTWIHIRRRHRHSGQRLSRSAAYFPSRGRARWVGGRRWALSRRRQSPRKVSFYVHFIFFWEKNFTLVFQGTVSFISVLLSMLVAKWEPTPCYRDAYLVGTPSGHFGRKTGRNTIRPRFLPCMDVFFWLAKGPFSIFGSYSLDVSHWEGQASWAW